jgi:hypothetical protein
MDIHKPKPWHGVREFLKEYVIIVVGVLTALAAEQIAEHLAWAEKVAVARAAMTTEIAEDDGPQVYQRVAMHNCLVARLNQIEAAVEGPASRADLVDLVESYDVQYVSYESLVRDGINSSGVAVHFPADQCATWTALYAEIPLLDRTVAQEARDIEQLRALRHTGGGLSEVERDRILVAAKAIRSDEGIIFDGASFALSEIFKAGLKLDPARMATFTGRAREHYGACVRDIRAS